MLQLLLLLPPLLLPPLLLLPYHSRLVPLLGRLMARAAPLPAVPASPAGRG